ncbi:TolB family protein [Fredinandcohnia sp. 179-A 10B2 NHS]|uniref:TolB family protein n=1 Tax=Fredinandcohnia sp. 179-A 10B2 NHS TaxID=3235176 RepID=UPI00399F7D78
MLRILLVISLLCVIFPFQTGAAEQEDVLASFIRKSDLWLLQNNKEIQITSTKNVYSKPTWSHDGKWLLYQVMTPSEFEANKQQVELWVYEVESGEKKKIFYDGYAPSWSPVKNIVAFNASGILNISDSSRFYNIATGVHSYTWLPDGSGFLLSTSGVIRPDGWSSAIIYTKKVSSNYKDVQLYGGVDHFFTLPREIGTTKDNQLIAVYAEQFAYSPSKKWISFVVSPTASWSMDSNMLCVISSDGKQFEVVDEIVFEVGEPKWAPTSDTIAFIAGHGRIVFGFKNKDLKIRDMPASGTLTPEEYADLDFDWVNDNVFVSSRIKEQEWNNDFKKHPLPSLFSIDIKNNKQMKITEPPIKYGDYSPQYIKSLNKIIWLRGHQFLMKTEIYGWRT